MQEPATVAPEAADPAPDRDAVEPDPGPREVPAPGSRRPLVLRLLAAVAGGLALWSAFPGPDLHWTAVLGVALLSAAVVGARARTAFLVGLVGGIAFFVPTLSWSGIFVGKLPWFALATLEALYLALMSVVIATVGTALRGRGPRWLPVLVVPFAWVAQELARGTTPFGGFPWARLAFSQAGTPLADLAQYGGAPLVTFAVALAGAGLYAVVAALVARSRGSLPTSSVAPGLAAGVVGVLVVALGSAGAVLAGHPAGGDEARVLAVQGNVPRPGLEFNAERRAVLDNHVAGTLRRQGEWAQDPPDVVLWPENSSDIDPLRNADAGAVIRSAVEGAQAPVLVGAVLLGPGDKVSNASLMFRPGEAVTERYVKQHPVPFAEYIPYRDFFRHFSDKVDYVSRDFAAGDRQGGFEIQSRSGADPYWVIPTICFEVAYDGLMRDAVQQQGRERSILVVQTNNATFGYSAESEQQLAISRLRAIEHGRSVVHVSTVGVSGFVSPDGEVHQKTGLFTAADLLGEVEVHSGTTVSDRLGPWPEYAATGLLVLLVLGSLGATVVGRRSRVRG